MQVIPFYEYNHPFSQALDAVIADADTAIITRQNAKEAVVMSLDNYNSLLETIHLLSSPANVAHLDRSIAEYRAGRAKVRELIDE